jgi:hypothetical protein
MNFLPTLYTYLLRLLMSVFYDNVQGNMIIQHKIKYIRVVTNDVAGEMLEVILTSIKVLLNICLDRPNSMKFSLRIAAF